MERSGLEWSGVGRSGVEEVRREGEGGSFHFRSFVLGRSKGPALRTANKTNNTDQRYDKTNPSAGGLKKKKKKKQARETNVMTRQTHPPED